MQACRVTMRCRGAPVLFSSRWLVRPQPPPPSRLLLSHTSYPRLYFRELSSHTCNVGKIFSSPLASQNPFLSRKRKKKKAKENQNAHVYGKEGSASQSLVHIASFISRVGSTGRSLAICLERRQRQDRRSAVDKSKQGRDRARHYTRIRHLSPRKTRATGAKEAGRLSIGDRGEAEGEDERGREIMSA